MNTVKIEHDGARKPEANKTNAAKLLAPSKSSNLPTAATNGADASTNIKKRAALQADGEGPAKKRGKVGAPMKPAKVRHSAKTPAGPDLARSFVATKCDGCNQRPCANFLTVLKVNEDLKTNYYKESNYKGVDGNNKRRRHFNNAFSKIQGGEEPGKLCGVEFARKWFPRGA
jgi:hypothetical protein